jgi:pyruvate/2-oxoglutarate/acetoin dehydrogenase E1 component
VKETVLDSLNRGLLSAMQQDEKVLLLGEDILDPYGGAFKVTRGCSTTYPDRVITTPISEAGLGGLAAGLALRGTHPVLEIMFGDFTTLLADQLINHISKFRWMYHDTVSLPLVIRTPMGGRRGYGPTHSQTLEKHFMGVPGLTVLAPVNLADEISGYSPGTMLQMAILNTESPVLFIENKLQYLLPVFDNASLSEFEIKRQGPVQSPAFLLRLKGAPAATVTLTAYGYMAELARQAQEKLAFEDEIFTELVIPTCLVPFDVSLLQQSVARTGSLVTIEEGGLTLGWGAETITRIVEAMPDHRVSVARVAARDLPVPAAPSLEKQVLPQLEDILAVVRKAAQPHA